MKKIFFVIMMLLTSLAQAADVQLDDGPKGVTPVADLVQDLKSSMIYVTLLDAQMSNLTTTNETLLKEYKVYAENSKQVAATFERTKDNYHTTTINPYRDQKTKEILAIAERYSSSCAPERVGDLPQAAYDRCLAWKANADVEIAHIRSTGDTHIRDLITYFNDSETKRTNTILGKQKDRMEEISNTMKANFTRWEDIRVANAKVRKHIDVLEGMFRNKCTGVKHAQTLKWCNSILWDGASKNLKPLPRG